MTTGPCSWKVLPSCVTHSQPQTSPLESVRSFVTLVFRWMRARSDDSAISSSFSMSPYVIVIPGNLSLPRCVRGMEWPPRRETRLRSMPKLSTIQSTAGALSSVSTLTKCGRLAPPRMQSASKISGLSWILSLRCDFVSAPLMPLVALVLFPPKKALLSITTTLIPCSKTVWAADRPPNPPPTTMTWFILSPGDGTGTEEA
mmetsp:Transcript_64153/g.178263  ORF Transcript_64153/g.178263 Transcript_64153/m.178263 type:complete len:201 (+) Transcript_64153:1029-1631(+)